MEKFGLKNALSMIFLPVMATFAISISIVFLAVLSQGISTGNSLENIGMKTYNAGDKSCMDLIITTLCIDTPNQDIGVSGMLDFFPWLILNIFGIGLMWTILMTTFKSTKFTSGIVDSLDKFTKNMVMTANIVPIGGGTSLAAIKNAGRSISGAIDTAAATNANTVISPAIENFLQKNITGQEGKGKKAINNAIANIKDDASATAQVRALVGPNGALYNAPQGAGVTTRGNQLDLGQYNESGLNLVNKLAETGKLNKKFNDVDEAFKDKAFLTYLTSLGLTPTEIKDLYTGRDGRLSKSQQEIVNNIASLAPTTPSGALSADKKTYTDADGSTFTLTKDGFVKKSKDGKDTKNLTKEDEWNSVVISAADLEEMKKATNITHTTNFNTWLTSKKTTASTTTANTAAGTATTPAAGTPAPANNTAAPAAATPPQTPPQTPPANNPQAGTPPANNNSSTNPPTTP